MASAAPYRDQKKRGDTAPARPIQVGVSHHR